MRSQVVLALEAQNCQQRKRGSRVHASHAFVDCPKSPSLVTKSGVGSQAVQRAAMMLAAKHVMHAIVDSGWYKVTSS